MASTGARYAVGIGGGAASGAAAGSALGPWGALVGGLIGGGAGAISAGLQGGEEDKAQAQLDEEQKRRKKELLIEFLRNKIAREGGPTDSIDAQRALQGLDRQEGRENETFQQQTAISPMAFVPIAQAGTQAAGRVYNSLNQPSQQQGGGIQLQPMPQTIDQSSVDYDPYSQRRQWA